ncbi:hypothetical protein ACET3Z_006313 [Daucus carota]
MALQNIGAGNKDDAFYMYKMPRMITKIEGRGNGIKTNVVNMVDIAKALGSKSLMHFLKLCLMVLERDFQRSAEAVKEVALALKVLYDGDVLEEEFIVEWYEKGLNGNNKDSLIWKNVKPFVEWLQSAESETEDE